MQDGTKFVGLDVSKDEIAVGIADSGRDAPRFHGKIPNTPEAIRKLIRVLQKDTHIEVCYEAGPTGYGLYRQLTSMEVPCIVVAPSLIPVRQGDRVKTDRRDALRLAQLLRAGELTPVWVPGKDDEALETWSVRGKTLKKINWLRVIVCSSFCCVMEFSRAKELETGQQNTVSGWMV